MQDVLAFTTKGQATHSDHAGVLLLGQVLVPLPLRLLRPIATGIVVMMVTVAVVAAMTKAVLPPSRLVVAVVGCVMVVVVVVVVVLLFVCPD